MTEPASASAPQPIHVVKSTATGTQVSSGFHAVGPNGQLVKLPPNAKLKPGWRNATQDDLDHYAEIERKRRSKDKSGEHEQRAKLAAAAAAKRGAVEAGGQSLAIGDRELAEAHARGDINHPWPARDSGETPGA